MQKSKKSTLDGVWHSRLRHGWIYNVSGLLGVEIELKGGSFIRLGIDEPNYLIQAIEDAKDNVQ